MTEQALIPLTYTEFASFLLARGEASAGRRATRAGCPLSLALTELTNQTWLVDFVQSEHHGWAECEQTGEFYTLPDWAYEFVLAVDRRGVGVPLTGLEAYTLLTAIDVSLDTQLNMAA